MTEEDLERLFTQRALATRSEAYQWLWTNRVEIAAVLAKHGRRPWSALAETAADYGKSFTPAGLRMAWQRLERDLARGGKTETPIHPPPPAKVPAPEAPATLPPDTADDDDNPFGFKLGAHPKRWTKPD